MDRGLAVTQSFPTRSVRFRGCPPFAFVLADSRHERPKLVGSGSTPDGGTKLRSPVRYELTRTPRWRDGTLPTPLRTENTLATLGRSKSRHLQPIRSCRLDG